MKQIVVLLLLSISIIVVNAQVRNTKWGMTKSQVMSSESIKPEVNNSDGLGYITYLNGTKVILYYMFNNDGKLDKIAYSVFENYLNSDKNFDQYVTFSALLKEKYGEPTLKFINKYNREYDKSKDWKEAVKDGDVSVSTNWETEDMTIICKIEYDEYEYKVNIYYYSKFYQQNQDKLKDL